MKKIIDTGFSKRQVDGHKMNAQSSRSHCIVSITLTQTIGYQQSSSKINIVDLAGSERIKNTNANEKQKVEAVCTNRSLSVLNSCIRALTDDTTNYIPYQHSRLTWLLQDTLGGTSKTVLLATISPSAAEYSATLSTLDYAKLAKQISRSKEEAENLLKEFLSDDPKPPEKRITMESLGICNCSGMCDTKRCICKKSGRFCDPFRCGCCTRYGSYCLNVSSGDNADLYYSGDLNIASWNIQSFGHNRGSRVYKATVERIVDFIVNYDIDCFFIQGTIDPMAIEDLTAAFNARESRLSRKLSSRYTAIGIGFSKGLAAKRLNPRITEYAAVLCRNNHIANTELSIECVDCDEVKFDEPAPLDNSSDSDTAAWKYKRAPAYCTITANDKKLTFISCHLASDSGPAILRLNEELRCLPKVYQYVKSITEADTVIILGDFNRTFLESGTSNLQYPYSPLAAFMKPVLSNVKSNSSKIKDELYDNFWLPINAKYEVSGSVGTNFIKVYPSDISKTNLISDHFPIVLTINLSEDSSDQTKITDEERDRDINQITSILSELLESDEDREDSSDQMKITADEEERVLTNEINSLLPGLLESDEDKEDTSGQTKIAGEEGNRDINHQIKSLLSGLLESDEDLSEDGSDQMKKTFEDEERDIINEINSILPGAVRTDEERDIINQVNSISSLLESDVDLSEDTSDQMKTTIEEEQRILMNKFRRSLPGALESDVDLSEISDEERDIINQVNSRRLLLESGLGAKRIVKSVHYKEESKS